MCASCYSECSLFNITHDFYGPAALVAAYQYSFDHQDSALSGRIKRLAGKHGVWECVRCHACSEACTQNIRHHEIISALSVMTNRHKPCKHAGAKHARAFLCDISKNGKLNESLLAWRTTGLRLVNYISWAVMMMWKGKLNFRSPKAIVGMALMISNPSIEPSKGC